MSLPLLRLPVRFPQIQREELITGVIQVAHDPMPSPQRLTSSAMENRPLEANVYPSNSSNQEDQPDQEPEVPVPHTADEESRTHIDTPVPEDPDDDLVCEGLFCHDVDVNALDAILEK